MGVILLNLDDVPRAIRSAKSRISQTAGMLLGLVIYSSARLRRDSDAHDLASPGLRSIQRRHVVF